MKNIKLLLLVTFSVFAYSGLTATAQAQNYLGDLTTKEEKKEDETKPIPKVFSSQLRSVNQAEKLDVAYYNLYVLLWNYSLTNYNHQSNLMGLMKAEKFRYTRNTVEFKGDLEAAMTALNDQNRKVQEALEKVENDYRLISEAIAPDELEKANTLWAEKMKEFKSHSKTYFKSQHNFLINYRNLVEFVIKQGGSYYFDSTVQSVRFYDLTGYTYFAQTLDTLNKINFDQKKYLRKVAPFLSALMIP